MCRFQSLEIKKKSVDCGQFEEKSKEKNKLERNTPAASAAAAYSQIYICIMSFNRKTWSTVSRALFELIDIFIFLASSIFVFFLIRFFVLIVTVPRISNCSILTCIFFFLFRFDSLTGVPSAQRTVAFEKACVLFNLGALHTQIGTRLERGTGDGLDGSVDNFLRAAAVFRFIVDNFTNAPSMDLAPQVLEAFILLMIVSYYTFFFWFGPSSTA